MCVCLCVCVCVCVCEWRVVSPRVCSQTLLTPTWTTEGVYDRRGGGRGRPALLDTCGGRDCSYTTPALNRCVFRMKVSEQTEYAWFNGLFTFFETFLLCSFGGYICRSDCHSL